MEEAKSQGSLTRLRPGDDVAITKRPEDGPATEQPVIGQFSWQY